MSSLHCLGTAGQEDGISGERVASAQGGRESPWKGRHQNNHSRRYPLLLSRYIWRAHCASCFNDDKAAEILGARDLSAVLCVKLTVDSG